MAPSDLRRPFKRPLISDQEKRRAQSLLRQAQNRQDAQRHARFLVSTVLTLPSQSYVPESQPEPEPELQVELELTESISSSGSNSLENLDVLGASKLKAAEARKWFAKQLMLPEWMIDVPNNLAQDWFVFARPSGKRCFVVSCNGTTISRLRNGSILNRFPSALPSGARKKESGSSQSYSILDCIFHELDQTYYVIDMVCWRGYSLSDCTAEFRFFWLNSKLAESGACEPPSYYHKYRFSLVPVYGCDSNGLQAAYSAPVPYVKDGLLFYNKHAHYQAGITPLALVWKDENCSQYVMDTDSKGQVPNQQQVVLELQEDGKLTTSDDPPIVFGCLDGSFIQQSGLHSGCLVRFSIGEGGLILMDGKLEKADLHYLGKANRARGSADSFSKVMFQYSIRHSPLKIDVLLESVSSPVDQESTACDVEMDG
ncbi:snurportin-1 isoform X1 [Vigna radiata var. radiata]|uniref:Snurportin-1 n=1 Tax=Vigna radiata var. radiata TaxID=3916 RepID=A0A1S3T808_VIGRR|nr:snurportin-1 isoform X1 [Vigna radiata var. radiata]